MTSPLAAAHGDCAPSRRSASPAPGQAAASGPDAARRAWVTLGLGILREGRPLSRVSPDEAARRSPAPPGPLADYFPDGAEGWHKAVIEAWLAERTRAAAPGGQPGRVRDPQDKLLGLRRAADATAAADRAMRDWAAAAPAAAAALEQARLPLAAALAAALADLGLAPADAALMTRLLLREYGCGPGDPTVPPGDDAEFTALLALVARTVRDDLLTVAEMPLIAGDPGGPLIMCITPQPGSEPGELQGRAREAALRHVIPLLAESPPPFEQPRD